MSSTLNVNVAVSATGSPPVSRVELWLSGEGQTDHVVASDSTYPYSFGLSTSTVTNGVDGIYNLRAVAYKTPDDRQIANTASRTVLVSNTHTLCARIGAARACADSSGVALQSLQVTAGTNEAAPGTFYVEEADRSAGVRVASSGSAIPAGAMVTILGTVANAANGERMITADKVWASAGTPSIGPLSLSYRDMGGAPPASEPYTNSITGGKGIYSIGMLTRAWGRVSYVGDGFFYIDDGSRVADGNALPSPVVRYPCQA